MKTLLKHKALQIIDLQGFMFNYIYYALNLIKYLTSLSRVAISEFWANKTGQPPQKHQGFGAEFYQLRGCAKPHLS